jgi:predicted metal-dependent phosphoesterase TrpH
LNAAADRGLDFVVFTEHNTNSHVRELTALQPYFDRLLLIPGMEMTTFQGHANAFNLREPVDFRVGSATVPDWNTLLKETASKGAIVSINHPRVPTGEACMGCG